jgi:hypothetical protein
MIDFNSDTIFKLKKDKTPNTKTIEPLLIPGEQIIGTYTVFRDHIVFTDKRIISVSVQGVTGLKKDFTILPYSKVTVYSVQTAGVMDIDSELELYFAGVGKVHFEFSGFSDIVAIGQAISQYVL